MLTQSSFLRLRPLSTHGLASKRPAAKFLGLILFEPKKSVKKFKVRTSLPTQCPHTSTVTFGPGVLSNIITSSCAWLAGARYCPWHGKPAVLGLHRCVRGFPRSFSKSRDRVIFFRRDQMLGHERTSSGWDTYQKWKRPDIGCVAGCFWQIHASISKVHILDGFCHRDSYTALCTCVFWLWSEGDS